MHRLSIHLISRKHRPRTLIALAVLTACTLILNPALAQAPATTPMLKVEVIEGEGAINNIRQRRAKEPVVRAVDENDQPLSGVSVTFMLPSMGPSGEFPGNVRELVSQTDDRGQAIGRGLVPNQMTGRYQIRVTASYRGETANAVINQTNAAPAGAASGGPSKKILLIALIGGVAAGGAAIAATRGGGSSSAVSQPAGSGNPAGIVITSGTPVFQPPH